VTSARFVTSLVRPRWGVGAQDDDVQGATAAALHWTRHGEPDPLLTWEIS
jgi:hypothetical protein